MTTELTLLALSAALGLVHVLLQGVAVSRQNGLGFAAGPRDQARSLDGIGGRLDRALRNFLETFPIFAALILIAHVGGRNDALTLTGAHLYFWARIVYLPLYAFGVPVLRSIVWGVSLVGIVLVLIALAL